MKVRKKQNEKLKKYMVHIHSSFRGFVDSSVFLRLWKTMKENVTQEGLQIPIEDVMIYIYIYIYNQFY